MEHSVLIRRPAGEVFAWLADPATHPRWRPAAVEFRALDDGPLAVGSRLREVVRFAGRQIATTYEVTELEPAKRFAVRSVEGPVRLDLRCLLEPAGGETRLCLELRAEAPGLFRLARPLFAWIMRRDLGIEARNLKELLEAGLDG